MELQHLGWNAVTIGFIGTVFFTLITLWGTLKQNSAIWQKKSGVAVSVPLFIYLTAMFTNAFIYGLRLGSLALIINGLLAIAHLPILIGLWRFKGMTSGQMVFGLLLIMALGFMIFSPYKDIVYLTFSCGAVILLITQPWEIWQKKTAGVVEIRLLVIYLLSNTFWTIYGYAINNWVMKITCPTYVVLILITITLWFKYQPSHHSTLEETSVT